MDYVDIGCYYYEMGNVGVIVNIIVNILIMIGGKKVDFLEIILDVFGSLNEIGGFEVNVVIGYYVIEFLLWGQDLNGIQVGVGDWFYIDYVVGKGCSYGNCDWRGEYIQVVVQLLVNDFVYMQGQWVSDKKDNYCVKLNSDNFIVGLIKVLFGMGSLVLGELVGERMKVVLIVNFIEDEYDCFSDNIYYFYFYDVKGIENIYFGYYVRVDGMMLVGLFIVDLVEKFDFGLVDVMCI